MLNEQELQEQRTMNEDRQVITEMAGGARIVCHDEGDGYSYELVRTSVPITSSQVRRLLDEGWIYSSNTAYFLTDEGKKAYLRSTDEMGDGRLLIEWLEKQ